MKTLTLQEIRDLNPCYDPIKYLPENWTGTIIDILNVGGCSVGDKLWVALKLIDKTTLDKFVDRCNIRDSAYFAVHSADAVARSVAYVRSAAGDSAAYRAAAARSAAYGAAADADAYYNERQKQLDILIDILKEETNEQCN